MQKARDVVQKEQKVSVEPRHAVWSIRHFAHHKPRYDNRASPPAPGRASIPRPDVSGTRRYALQTIPEGPVIMSPVASAYLAVAVGGALGSVTRFWLTGVMTALTGPRFPWGTLLINVLGSFIIGLVAGLTLTPERLGWHPSIRIFLMTGFCGGFTTFSAFSLQALELIQTGETAMAFGYMLASVALCLAFTLAGWQLARP